MKLDGKEWMAQFCQAVTEEFEGRVLCIGLQGSRGRGEEREDSDIDVVVVLDRVELEDLDRYRRAVAELPGRELLCGFLSGKEELLAWEPGDLFQFYHDTVPVLGDLEFLRERFTREDAGRAVHTGLCDLYHGCVHNYLHERDGALLAGLYKSAVFTLQANYWLKTGVYVKKHRELWQELTGEEWSVLERALAFRSGEAPDLEKDSALLLQWTGRALRQVGAAIPEGRQRG